MKTIFIKTLLVVLSLVIFAFSYTRINGAYDWYVWSIGYHQPYEEKGSFSRVHKSTGRHSCQCTIISMETPNGLIHLHSQMSKNQRERALRSKGDFLVKYYPAGNGENKPLEIIYASTGELIYGAKIYTGHGIALTSLVFGLIMFAGGSFLLLIAAGVIKTDAPEIT